MKNYILSCNCFCTFYVSLYCSYRKKDMSRKVLVDKEQIFENSVYIFESSSWIKISQAKKFGRLVRSWGNFLKKILKV